jgi:hypothetical protein
MSSCLELAGSTWLLSCLRDARTSTCQYYTPSDSDTTAATAISNVAAQVPGCVHSDLARAGIIGEMYMANNESKQAWIAYSDWEYTTLVTLPPVFAKQSDYLLVFESLDTIGMLQEASHQLGDATTQLCKIALPLTVTCAAATVSVNGVQVGSSRNMFRQQAFEISKELLYQQQPALLSVKLFSAVVYGLSQREASTIPIPVCRS